VGEKKTVKNCGKEEEEDFLDKIKEVLIGRFCFMDRVCGCYVCMYACMYVWLK
jgi:hypothetical protein